MIKHFLFPLITFAVFLLACSLYLDPDFGWHLQSGVYILNHGIPAVDQFTYTASDFPVIYHEWFHDVVTAVLYMMGGYPLLLAVFSALWTACIYLASRSYNLFIITLSTLVMLEYTYIRAAVWSFLFIVILERILTQKNEKILFVLPFLFALWANLHGGFVLGLALLAFYLIVQKDYKNLWVVPLSFLATCINPYVWNVYIEIGRTMFDMTLSTQVNEWMPFSFSVLSLIAFVFFAIILWKGATKKDLKNYVLLMPLGLFVLSLKSTRTMPFFILTSLRYFEEKFTPTSLIIKRGSIILSIALLLLASYFLLFTMPPRHFPAEAVAYFKKHQCTGNIFNSYNYGGYLIGSLPKYKVYIDGRMPSWEKNDVKYLDTYNKVFSDRTVRKTEFEKHNIKCVIVDKNEGVYLIPDLEKEGWVRVADTISSAALVKN